MTQTSSRRAILTRGTTTLAALLVEGDIGTAAQRIEEEEKDVRELIASFAAAWSRHDVKGMGALHTDDVNFTNIWGSWARGRTAIEQGFAAGHSTVFSQSKMVIDIEQVRFPPLTLQWHTVRWNCWMFLLHSAVSVTQSVFS